MIKRGLKFRILCWISVIFLMSSVVAASMGKPSEERDLQQAIQDISEDEKKILEELFLQAQQIEVLRDRQTELEDRISDLNRSITELSRALEKAGQDYDYKLKFLETVLTSYQRNGAGSFFKVLLNAGSVSELLNRWNIFREFSADTDALLKEIKEERARMGIKKEQLDRNLSDLKREQTELENTMKETEKAMAKNEEMLAALQGDREKFEERLKWVGEGMEKLEETLNAFTVGINDFIRQGYLPDDVIRQEISLSGFKGVVDENAFNRLFKEENLPPMIVKFHKDMVEVSSEEYGLEMSGLFEPTEGTKLKFSAQKGSFFGMKLDRKTLDNLLSKGYLTLDLTTPLEGNSIQKIKVREGYLDIFVKVSLFGRAK